MISYEKIIGHNTNKEAVKCMVCNHYYFKDRFDYQPHVCYDCHEFSMTVKDLNDFFVLTIKEADYRVYISNIDKKEAMNILKNSELYDKRVF